MNNSIDKNDNNNITKHQNPKTKQHYYVIFATYGPTNIHRPMSLNASIVNA